MKRSCKWCGSQKHDDKHCSISKKHQMLLDGATPQEAGFIVLDCTTMDDVAEKVDAVHTLLT